MQVTLACNADGQTYCGLITFDVDMMIMLFGDKDKCSKWHFASCRDRFSLMLLTVTVSSFVSATSSVSLTNSCSLKRIRLETKISKKQLLENMSFQEEVEL